ncbi:MAG: hypothetical protein A2Y33_01405 [Spirochaetes bacterium GWF1_51_8]|nr:MAG: hypothetical protein A2Y33_01405 [Spirochaetes bacterium GWF1_51_8]
MRSLSFFIIAAAFFIHSCAMGKFSLGEYRSIDRVVLSPNCKSAAVMLTDMNGKTAIVLDGTRLGIWENIVGWGFDGQSRFFELYQNNSNTYLYYKGKSIVLEQPFNSVIVPEGFDGIALVFLTSYQQYLKIWDTFVGPYYSLAELVFSETNNRWGAIVRTDKGYEVWIDGKKQGDFHFAEGLVFSGDAGTAGYAFAKAEKAAIVVNDTIIAEGIGISGPWLNYTGSVYYYAKYSPSKIELLSNQVTVAEIPHGGTEIVRNVYLTPAGRLFGYTYSVDMSFYTVLNGITYGPFDVWPDRIRFSADGKNFVFYAEKDQKGYIYTSGEVVGPFAVESPARVFISQDGVSYYAAALATDASYWIYSHKGKFGPYSYITDLSVSRDFSNFTVCDWDNTAYRVYLNGTNIAVCSNECAVKPLLGGSAVIAEVIGNELIIREWKPEKP